MATLVPTCLRLKLHLQCLLSITKKIFTLQASKHNGFGFDEGGPITANNLARKSRPEDKRYSEFIMAGNNCNCVTKSCVGSKLFARPCPSPH